tara:strand:+ start:824 stop:1324 length:501 start_codon:yes stop_codon:yes gene_type:complete
VAFDATFWVAVSFLIFFGVLFYFKIPQKVIDLLDKMIIDIKNEIDESEKLRSESKILLDNSQQKLDAASVETKKILEQAKSDSEKLVVEMNDKFFKSAELRKNLAKTKITQMKDAAIKDIKNSSVKLAISSVEKIITSSVDKNKLDNLFEKNLEETKLALKNINSK